MKKNYRSFICILSFSLVLASVFSIGANAVYFSYGNVPLDRCQHTNPQSVAEVIVNDGTKSFAAIQGIVKSPNVINGMFIFGVPNSVTRYDLYLVAVVNKNASDTGSPSWVWDNSSIIRGHGLNFNSGYNDSNFDVGYTGSRTILYDSTPLAKYVFVKLTTVNGVNDFSISDITRTNFQFRYGYIDSNGEYHWVTYFSYPPSLSSMDSDLKTLMQQHYSNAIDLHSNGTTTRPSEEGTLGTGSDTEPDFNVIVNFPDVTGDGFGGEVNTEDFSKLDEIIENLTDLSADMSSNLGEMSDQFARVRSSIDGFISNVPGVIVACIVCAMIILIAVKIIGR